jgi:hypothetical protein
MGFADRASSSLVTPVDVRAVQKLALVIVEGLLDITRGEADRFARGWGHAWTLRPTPGSTHGAGGLSEAGQGQQGEHSEGKREACL